MNFLLATRIKILILQRISIQSSHNNTEDLNQMSKFDLVTFPYRTTNHNGDILIVSFVLSHMSCLKKTVLGVRSRGQFRSDCTSAQTELSFRCSYTTFSGHWLPESRTPTDLKRLHAGWYHYHIFFTCLMQLFFIELSILYRIFL